jgi:hypothetical protein
LGEKNVSFNKENKFVFMEENGNNVNNYYNQISYEWPVNLSNLAFTVFPNHLDTQQDSKKN